MPKTNTRHSRTTNRARAGSLRADLEFLIARRDGEHMIEALDYTIDYTIDFNSWPHASQLAVLMAIARHAPPKDAAAFKAKVQSAAAQNRTGDLIRQVADLLGLYEGDITDAVIKLENARTDTTTTPALAVIKGGAA